MHVGNSTSHPMMFGDVVAECREFVHRHPPPFKVPFHFARDMAHDSLPLHPSKFLVTLGNFITTVRVWITVMMLRLVGKARLADKLRKGLAMLKMANRVEMDLDLWFSVKNTEIVSNALVEEEKGDFKMLCTSDTFQHKRLAVTFFAFVYKSFFKKDIPADGTHDFVFYPDGDVSVAAAPMGVERV
jgi:hypothetical protein